MISKEESERLYRSRLTSQAHVASVERQLAVPSIIEMPMRTVVCPDCQATFEVERCFMGGQELFSDRIVFCDPCEDARAASALKQQKVQLAARYWGEYLEDIGKHYGRATKGRALELGLRDVIAWSRAQKPGVMVTGGVGKGKTSALSVLVKRLMWNHGKPLRCTAINGPEIKRLGDVWYHHDSPQQKAAMARHETLKRAPICVLDDLDKCKFSPAAVERVYEIIEHRLGEESCTLITCNSSGDDLVNLMRVGEITPQYAMSVVRRIGDMCDIISIP